MHREGQGPRDRGPQRTAGRDLYDELGVSPTASAEEIKKAFRALALRYHPDKNPGDEIAAQKMRTAASAYDVLKDEARRTIYDKHRASGGSFESFDREEKNRAHAEEARRAKEARGGRTDDEPYDDWDAYHEGQRAWQEAQFARWFAQRLQEDCSVLFQSLRSSRSGLFENEWRARRHSLEMHILALRDERLLAKYLADYDAMALTVARDYVRDWFNGGWIADARRRLDAAVQHPGTLKGVATLLRGELQAKVDIIPDKKAPGLFRKLEDLIAAKSSQAEQAQRKMREAAAAEFGAWYTRWLADVIREAPMLFQDADYVAIRRKRVQLEREVAKDAAARKTYLEQYDKKMQEMARRDIDTWLRQLAAYLRSPKIRHGEKEKFRSTFVDKVDFLLPHSDRAAYRARFEKL